MKWDTRLEDTQSDYYKKMSTSACEFVSLSLIMYSIMAECLIYMVKIVIPPCSFLHFMVLLVSSIVHG